MTTPAFAQAEKLAAAGQVIHGFFGRDAGDMSETLGTTGEIVAANRKAACIALGIPDSPLISLKQTHSTDVVSVDGPLAPDARPEADGVVTAVPGLALSILTADCAPLLFADPEAGVIGACHAGWKGAVNGVIGNTIKAMQELGAVAERITGAIGPTISGANYEVGPEFAAEVTARDPEAAAFLFTPDGKTREHFDLPGFALSQTTLAGVRRMTRVGGCTFGNPDRYFSHRQTQQNGLAAGRQIAIIALEHVSL